MKGKRYKWVRAWRGRRGAYSGRQPVTGLFKRHRGGRDPKGES